MANYGMNRDENAKSSPRPVRTPPPKRAIAVKPTEGKHKGPYVEGK